MSTDNRFDVLRLVFAGIVMIYHGVALFALTADSGLEVELAKFAELSIQGFFILSGVLVAGSYARSQSVADYAMKRVRRLYPAYAVVILVPAFVAWVLHGRALEVLRYVGANLLFLNFLEPNLPGLFEGHRFTAVNGALWTLKIEVLFYACLPILMWIMGRCRSWWPLFLLALYAGGEVWRMMLPELVDGHLGPVLARQLPGQMAFFACGMAIWKIRDSGPAQPLGFALLSGGGLLALCWLLWGSDFEPLKPIALASAVAFIAFMPGWKPAASKYGDVSYGIYITHFPIIQMFVAFGIFDAYGLGWSLIAATGVVLVASFALWHMVEKRALRPTSHYRQV